ncbi:MAG TPA: DNA polymerase III [Rectinemataceae bacterium]|nr:DNA polymerase III [Rectinemataceae bacterium]
MFDNLIGQEEARALLEGDIRGDSLPPSLLLSGPPASGKLTAALEVARILSCEAELPGAWACPCPACSRHRSLSHPDLLLLGRRSFPEEIAAALDTLAAAPGKAGAYFFIRAIRKLEKRFDASLWEGEESKLSKAAGLLADLEERLSFLDPESGNPVTPAMLKEAAAIVAIATKLGAMVPDMPPVAQVRSVEWWARLAPWGRRKTVIIENADAMNESSRNALLKILEEPPPSVSFVLVSARRHAMMRTILSRVRSYPFWARDAASSREVLAKVFRVDLAKLEGEGPALLTPERWLASKRALPPEQARHFASDLVAAIVAGRLDRGAAHGSFLAEAGRTAGAEGLDIAGAIAATLAGTKDLGQKDEAFADSFDAILSAIEESLGEALRASGLGAGDLAWMATAADILREARVRSESFNLPAATLLETLAYRLRDIGIANGAEARDGRGFRGASPSRGQA